MTVEHTVDLKNQANPLQSNVRYYPWEGYKSIDEMDYVQIIDLYQNELTLKDGRVGFLEEEPEPIKFLSEGRTEKSYVRNNLNRPGTDDTSTYRVY